MQAFDVRITQENEPEANVIIGIGLETANDAAAIAQPQPLNVLVYNKESLMAGVTGHTIDGTLIVRHIWVERTFRSQGIARSIMDKLENEAQGRGCKTSFVDVMTYQVPDFFAKVGYNEINRIKRYQMDHDRIFLSKELT